MVDEEYNAELEDGSASGLNNEAGRPRVRKAADAFRTISEVADELHVPQHVLRFWETKFPQVRPLKRGGGRRYYRPEDVGLLRRVADLLYTQGYTIKGVQRLLRDGGMAPDAPAERNPPPAQDFLIPPEPSMQRAPSLPPANPLPQPELEEFTNRLLPDEDEPAYALAPIPEPARPQAAAAVGEEELTRLRALLSETLSALEELRRALD
ncbi:MAG: MerR family transcriptional regulator [Rhodospirillales bacterium]|nr:MerR family transcriptional regulator [Rhodospirillales bacterium]